MEIRNIEVENIRGWGGREMNTRMQLRKLTSLRIPCRSYASKFPVTRLQIILLNLLVSFKNCCTA